MRQRAAWGWDQQVQSGKKELCIVLAKGVAVKTFGNSFACLATMQVPQQHQGTKSRSACRRLQNGRRSLCRRPHKTRVHRIDHGSSITWATSSTRSQSGNHLHSLLCDRRTLRIDASICPASGLHANPDPAWRQNCRCQALNKSALENAARITPVSKPAITAIRWRICGVRAAVPTCCQVLAWLMFGNTGNAPELP